MNEQESMRGINVWVDRLGRVHYIIQLNAMGAKARCIGQIFGEHMRFFHN